MVEMVRVLTICHRDKEQVAMPTYHCPTCGDTFPSERNYLEECPYCGSAFPDGHSVQSHKERHASECAVTRDSADQARNEGDVEVGAGLKDDNRGQPLTDEVWQGGTKVVVPAAPLSSKARKRAKRWIVSTHIVSAGFLTPILSWALALLLLKVIARNIGGFNQAESVTLLLVLFVGAFHFIGISRSLAYLEKYAVSDDWYDCTTPTVIGFALISFILWFIALFLIYGPTDFELIVVMLLYVSVVVVFAKKTAGRFRMLQARDNKDANRTP